MILASEDVEALSAVVGLMSVADLDHGLEVDLPGIFQLALMGLDKLHQSGYIVYRF